MRRGRQRRPRRHRTDEEAVRLAREVAQRAVRRLDILEWVMYAGAAALALGAGALLAWLLEGLLGWAFRPTWTVASLVLFVVPGAITLHRIRRDEREARSPKTTGNDENDG